MAVATLLKTVSAAERLRRPVETLRYWRWRGGAMPVPSARLKTYITGHLDFHATQRWPQLEEITIAWRGGYGYVTGHLPGDEQLPLCRLRYLGSDTDWGFAIPQASSESYNDTLLPDGNPTGTPEQALDCTLGLYLADPSA